VETVAEKFVALTRRADAELADAGLGRDSALVRNIYDLHVLRAHNEPGAAVTLAKTIMRCGGQSLLSTNSPPIAITRLPRLFGRSRAWPLIPALLDVTSRSGGHGVREVEEFEIALATILALADQLNG
jgi:hypothetical protein